MERKLKRFNILLDDESLLYFPGSFLTGQVLLELEEETPALGLYFHIIGEGVVSFNQASKKRRQSNNKLAPSKTQDRESYLDFRLQFLGDKRPSGDDGEDDEVAQVEEFEDDSDTEQKVLTLSPGVHNFPFKLGLPQNLPSTFLGSHGWLQYFCRAVLEQPSGLVHKNQQVFIIINPIDLNNEPESLRQPFYCEAEEELRSGLCSPPGLVSCKVRLDRGGFVPGECIQVSATIENSSKTVIKRTRATLTETVEYRVKHQIIQSETRELAAIERGKVAPHDTDVWKKEALHIPALPPTNLRGCHLIKINYDVFFEIHTRDSKNPIKLQLPIVMATYPVRNKDGTLKRRKDAHYPNSLPIFRSWMGAPTLK